MNRVQVIHEIATDHMLIAHLQEDPQAALAAMQLDDETRAAALAVFTQDRDWYKHYCSVIHGDNGDSHARWGGALCGNKQPHCS